MACCSARSAQLKRANQIKATRAANAHVAAGTLAKAKPTKPKPTKVAPKKVKACKPCGTFPVKPPPGMKIPPLPPLPKYPRRNR